MKQIRLLARTCLLLATVPVCAVAQTNATGRAILDADGRQIVPGGYVTITEDAKGKVHYSADDYRRMVRMGANFQVIRTTLGRLGGWPGHSGDPNYPGQLDDMVRMGRDAGLNTIFKLVVYDLRPFGEQEWDAIYHNTDGAQDALLAAWRKLWIRYRDEPSVFGYDLLNEPQRGLNPDETLCVRDELLPTLRRLTDAMHSVSPEKWALYQPLYRETGTGEGPFLPMTEPFGRDRVIYAPHLYSMDIPRMRKLLNRYVREATLSQAPLLLGEWGPATDISADTDPAQQKRYTEVYEKTSRTLDQRGIGAIKAWYTGTRTPLKSSGRPAPFTWAIFSDTSPGGRVERKFITDALARPRPLLIAGRLERYGYEFDSRLLEIRLRPGLESGSTEIFIPAQRHYPQGFKIDIGSGLTLARDAGSTGLRTVRAIDPSDREQMQKISWNDDSQHLVIEKWVTEAEMLTVKIRP